MRWVLVAFAVFGLGACAGSVTDIDRTQPNKLRKSLFVDEWYYLATVVEVDYAGGLFQEGLQDRLERIVWDIQKDTLFAYRSYEVIAGGERSNGSLVFQGAPVAAFAIESHFDVVRRYNEATGEQSNVLVENTADRPWFEREYMRVDWSVDRLDNRRSLSGLVDFFSSAPYYVQEHEIDNPYRPEITPNYISVVNNYQLDGNWLYCAIVFRDTEVCGNTEAKIRLSFKKVDPTNDYVPLYYPDKEYLRDVNGAFVYEGCFTSGNCERLGVEKWDRFPIFRHERLAFDDEFIFSRDNRVFLGHRHNIWEESRAADGSVLPLSERREGKVVYYKNVDFPDDVVMTEMASEVSSEWDVAFRDTIAQARNVAGVRNVVGDDFSVDDVDTVFEVRENGCTVAAAMEFAEANGYVADLARYGITGIDRANLKRACSVLEFVSDGAFVWQKLGDLRYSFLHWTDSLQPGGGPLGFGLQQSDPVTGEIVTASAFTVGTTVERIAAFGADVVSVMNGDLNIDEVVSGSYVRDFLRQNNLVTANRIIDPNTLASMSSQSGERGFSMTESVTQSALDAQARTNGRMQRLVQDPQGWALLNEDLARVAAAGAIGLPASFSPPAFVVQDAPNLESEAMRQLERHSFMMPDAYFEDPGLLWLAEDIRDEGLSWQEIYERMRGEIFRSVALHEVGHTVGMRHNFQGSTDALNFHQEFWDGYDPTQNEVPRTDVNGARTGVERYMYSSIMDYSARTYGEMWQGLGPFDRASIRFVYGDLLEEWNFNTIAFQNDFLSFYTYGHFPKILSAESSLVCFTNDCAPNLLAALEAQNQAQTLLSEAAALRGQNRDAEAQIKEDEAQAANRLFDQNTIEHLRDGLQGAPAVTGNIWNRRYVTYQDVVERARARGSDFAPELVPYRQCPDEIAGFNRPECSRWDFGATFAEFSQDRIDRYWAYYFFTHYKRDRFDYGSNPQSVAVQNYRRTMRPLASMYPYLLFSDNALGEDTNGVDVPISDFPIGRDWQAGAINGLNFLQDVVMSPEPGVHCLDATDNTYRPLEGSATCASGDVIDVPLGIGRYLESRWNNELEFKMTRVGVFYDKLWALVALTSSNNAFFRTTEDIFDFGAFAFSAWSQSEYQAEIQQAFDWAFTGSPNAFSMRYDGAATDNMRFQRMPMINIYQGAPSASLPMIEPSLSYTLRQWGIVLPIVSYSGMFDYTEDFVDVARVCQVGGQACRDFGAAGGSVRQYQDPLTGWQYEGVAVDANTPGARMLEAAQDYADNVYAPRLQAYRDAHDAGGVPLGSFALTPDEIASGASFADIADDRAASLAEARRVVTQHTNFVEIAQWASQVAKPN